MKDAYLEYEANRIQSENNQLHYAIDHKIEFIDINTKLRKEESKKFEEAKNKILDDAGVLHIQESARYLNKLIDAWIIQSEAFAKMLHKIGQDKELTDSQLLEMHKHGMMSFIENNHEFIKCFGDNNIDISEIINYSDFNYEIMGDRTGFRSYLINKIKENHHTDVLKYYEIDLVSTEVDLCEPNLYKENVKYVVKKRNAGLLVMLFGKKEKRGDKTFTPKKI